MIEGTHRLYHKISDRGDIIPMTETMRSIDVKKSLCEVCAVRHVHTHANTTYSATYCLRRRDTMKLWTKTTMRDM